MKKSRQVMLAEPVLGSREKEAVARVLEEGWLTMGPRVRAFEEAFARMHGRDDALATSSCTAALHLALAAFDIGPGDEVLVPSLTFVATANAVRYLGARPVFVDIESPMRPWISLADAERKLSARTKAVIVVHYAGYVADMRAWRAFADAYGLWLVEDAAHAPESAGKDGLADASAYSFFSNKNMTTAEGGMLLMRDPERLARARCMRSHGMTTLTWDRHQGHAYSYDVVALGYNYRLDELRAAIGLAQLEELPKWNAKRRRLSAHYRALLVETDIRVPFSAEMETDAHLMPVLLPERVDRMQLMEMMRGQGVQTSIHYPPVHRFSAYEGFSDALPNTEAFASREVSLPLHPQLSERDVERVVDIFVEAVARCA